MEYITELETAIFESEGIRDLLGMLADCAAEGAQSLDNYTMGISLLFNLAHKNVEDLNRAKDRLTEKIRESITAA